MAFKLTPMSCSEVSDAKIRKIEAASGKTKESGKYVFWRLPFFRFVKVYNGNLAMKCLNWIDPAIYYSAVGKYRTAGI